jgi:hypothetical protein
MIEQGGRRTSKQSALGTLAVAALMLFLPRYQVEDARGGIGQVAVALPSTIVT